MEGAPRHWWDDKRFLLLTVFAMAIPLLRPGLPPLVDLPGHMGRYRVQLDWAHSPVLESFYSFQWQLIGNLGVDLLVIPLAPIFGLELAVKLIVMAIPVLTALGLIWIAREVHGRIPPAAFFALPLAYGHPFHFGFVNFALSMALALNAFALWLRLGRLGKEKLRAVMFVPIGLLLWLCHTFGWATLGVMAFAAETVRTHDRTGGWWRPMVTAALHCLVLAPPLVLMLMWRSGQVGGQTADWFNISIKALWFMMILRDRWLIFDAGSVLFLLGVLLHVRHSAQFEFSRMLGVTAIFLFVTFLILPRIVFGSAYADMRITPFMLAIALIAIRPKPESSARAFRGMVLLALCFFGVRLAATTVSFWRYADRHEAAMGAIAHLPKGARLISFVGRGCHLPWYTNRMEHLPAMALVRKHAFSNDQWAMAGAQLLGVRKQDAFGFNHDASQIVTEVKCKGEVWRTIDDSLRKFPRQAYDYVWLIEPPRFDRSLLSGMTLVWGNGQDALYRIESREPLSEKPL